MKSISIIKKMGNRTGDPVSILKSLASLPSGELDDLACRNLMDGHDPGKVLMSFLDEGLVCHGDWLEDDDWDMLNNFLLRIEDDRYGREESHKRAVDRASRYLDVAIATIESLRRAD